MEVEEYCCYCGTCSNVCPEKAIELSDNEKVEIDNNACIKCGICVKACPVGAIYGL
jgi:ferredoxin